jgi:hypothetical protein
MNLEQLLHSPQAKPIAAVGGIGAVVVLALHARNKAKAGGATSSGSYVSAVPPANQANVQPNDVLGQVLGGLRDATGTLLDAANQMTQNAPPAASGSSSTAPAAAAVAPIRGLNQATVAANFAAINDLINAGGRGTGSAAPSRGAIGALPAFPRRG